MALTCRASRDLPYDRAALFALVADVEHYPSYMPGWRAVRVLARHPDGLSVRQIVTIAGLRQDFTSRAWLAPPQSLRIVSEDGPFRRFELLWRFTPLPGGGTRVEGELTLRLRSPLLDALAARLRPDLLANVVAALERRAAGRLTPVPRAQTPAPAPDQP
ncbi:type II toxin-antitoxin system RatA family toxin [Acidocella sp.]|uniref:type II toxin-antitoxin system RatA family toxin n=1 Tax=Acidocella sp. TaxID=50710 RepID=UPI002606303C|nr:type II toxin-antitoxin system RatA family toxin [Acidocella sp.]